MVIPSRDLGCENKGFTLIELLIAIVIASIILGSMFTTLITHRKYYSVQEQMTEMVQGARAAIDMITREVQMGGYNPGSAAVTGIPYSAVQLEILADLNGDGDTSDANEAIIYSFDAAHLTILRNTGGSTQTFAENVTAFNFSYLDASGNATVITADIRQIQITITVRTSKPDPDYATNSGYRTMTLTSRITPRNLAYNN